MNTLKKLLLKFIKFNLEGKVTDERIINQTFKTSAIGYKLILIMSLISIFLKIYLYKFSFSLFITELFIFTVPTLYLFIKRSSLNLPLIINKKLKKDEYIEQNINKIYNHCFIICFIFCLSSAFVRTFFLKDYLNSAYDMAIFLIPGFYLTFINIKNGVYVYGSKKVEKKSIKRLKISLIFSSILYGILVNWNNLFINGRFTPNSISDVIISAITWGIVMYLLERLFYKLSGKMADKHIDKD